MDVDTSTKLPLGRIKAFLKQLQQLAWLELFEKWFGLGVKLLWITLFVAFAIYLRKEYKKDIYYIQDFKVPPACVEQGYSGEVVKQAIIDDIGKIINSAYSSEKSMTPVNEDGIELLSDFSIEGFNLKAVTRSIMAIFGKKNKHIGGYVTLNDSTQTAAIQVTDQITQPISIRRNEPAQNLIRKATLEIMKVRSPGGLIAHYMTKNDTVMVKSVYNYLSRHRELTKDFYFYELSISMALYERRTKEAFAWADSLELKFPNDKWTFYERAKIYALLAYYTKSDTATTNKNKRLYVENLLKAKEPGRTTENYRDIDDQIDIALAGFYYNEKDYKSFIPILERMRSKQALNAAQYNGLAYAYFYQKDYGEAEIAVQRAVLLAGDVGDYWDSLAEIYSVQGKDSLAVANLAIALKSPQKSAAVSVQAYQTDARWDRLRKRSDFQALLTGKADKKYKLP